MKVPLPVCCLALACLLAAGCISSTQMTGVCRSVPISPLRAGYSSACPMPSIFTMPSKTSRTAQPWALAPGTI